MTIWLKSKLGNISVVFTVVPLLLALLIALAGAFQELPLAFGGRCPITCSCRFCC